MPTPLQPEGRAISHPYLAPVGDTSAPPLISAQPTQTRLAGLPRSGGVPQNSQTRFRPDIEGLRGVAVLLVVLFHCGVPGFGGGFTGVDVFFALSGYLITGLIVSEVERTGSLNFRNFYARRVRRLLPASGLVVVSTLALCFFVYSPLELASYANWASYTSLYISNYMFIFHAANYFASDVTTNPYLHTWSLAVEEQFYLFWPAMIAAILALWRSRRGLATVLFGVSVVSFGMCVWLTYGRPAWAFFSLPPRAWEFALGGLGCLLGRSYLVAHQKRMEVVGWAGLAGIIASGCLFSAQIKFPGYAAMLPIAGTLAALIPGALGIPSALRTLLGSSVLQYFGRLSYSWYLWHWPVLVLADARFPSLTWRGRLLAAVIALGLSQITFWILEKPVRFSSFLVARPALSLSLAVIVAALGISAARLAQSKARSELVSGQQAQLLAAATDTRVLFNAHCLTPAGVARVKKCEYGDHESSTRMVLFGDSHAEQWFPALDAIANQRHWRLVTVLKSSCPAARVTVYSTTLKREDTECSAWREAALAEIVRLNPYVVILSEKDPVVVRHNQVVNRPTISAEKWGKGLLSTIAYLQAHGLKTLVIADVPRAPLDMPTCLSRAAARSWGAHDCVIHRETALNDDARQAESLAVKSVPGAKLVDFSEKFCTSSVCQSMVDGQVVYRDSNHITSNFARALEPLLEQQIDAWLSQ